MNVSRFMNLAAIFSLDLESQYIWTKFRWKSVLLKIFSLSGFLIKQLCIFNWQTQDLLLGNCLRAKTWIKSLLVEIARLGRRKKPGCFAASNYFPDTMYYFRQYFLLPFFYFFIIKNNRNFYIRENNRKYSINREYYIFCYSILNKLF